MVPIGTRRGLAKQGGVYYSLMCIPDKYRSTLSNILLAQLHNYTDHAEYGNLPIFNNIIEELKDLEDNGITLEINGLKKQIYFALLTVVGDNLGLNTVLGFVCSFNAHYCCRFCIANIEQRQTQVVVNNSLLRTEEHYLNPENKSDYGVQGKCIFNILKCYHVTINMCTDIDHDLREGVCRYTLGKSIKHFVQEGYFTIEELNNEIRLRDCTPSQDTNVTPFIRENQVNIESICLTATEMTTLMDFYVGHKVPASDKH